MTIPTLKLEIAFVNNPFDSSPTWVDVTADMSGSLGDSLFQASRGKNYYLGKIEAGQTQIRLRNLNGQYTPSNTSGTHYPNVLPWRPIRVTATLSGTTYGVWRGLIKSWTQRWEAQEPLVDLTCVDALQLFSSYTSLPQTYDELVLADYGFTAPGSGPIGYWQFDETTGPYLSTPDTGKSFSAVGGGISQVAGMSRWATQIVPSSGLDTGTLFSTLGGGEFWFQLLALPTVPGVTGAMCLFQNVSGFELYNPLEAASYEKYADDAQIALYAYMSPTNYLPSDDAAGFEGSVGSWTANNANTTLSRSTTWWMRGTHSLKIASASTTGTIEAASPFADFGSNVGGQTVTVRTAVTDSAAAVNIDFYTSGGALISTVAAVRNVAGISSPTGASPGTAQDFTYNGAAPTNTQKLKVRISSSGYTTGNGFMADTIAVYCAQGVTSHTRFFLPSDAGVVHLQWHGAQHVADVITGFAASTWHHFAFNANIGSTGYHAYLDGVALTVSNVPTGSSASPNRVYVGQAEWTGATFGAYARMIIDSLLLTNTTPVPDATLAASHYAYGLTRHESPQGTSNQRITDLLDIYGWPAADRVIETGGATVLETGALTGGELMPYIQAAVDAELGNFFIDGSGRATFHTRGHRNASLVNALAAEDASFEGGTVGAWAQGANWTIANSVTRAHAGTHSMLATRANGTVGNGFASLGVTLVAGAAYTLSAWVWGGTGAYDIHVIDAASVSAHTNFAAPGSAWQQVSVTFTATATGSGGLYVSDDPNGAPTNGATLYIDDLKVLGVPVAVFGENTGAGEIPYLGDIQIVTDDTYLFNEVTVTQSGSGYTTDFADSTSQTTYGVRPLSPRTVILANTADIAAQAATLLTWYDTPRDRVAVITVEGRSREANFPTMLAREIGDLVTVKRRSIGGPTVSLDVFIDGISHVIGPSSWRTTFQLTPKYPATTY